MTKEYRNLLAYEKRQRWQEATQEVFAGLAFLTTLALLMFLTALLSV